MGAFDLPAIRGELAAKAAAHVVHLDVYIVRLDLERASHLISDGGHALCGWPIFDFVTLPRDHGPVRFQAAVSDDGDAVSAFGDDLGFFETGLGIAGDL